MPKLRSLFAILFSLSALGAVGYGISQSLHSNLFLLRVVEVADLPENSPVDSKTIETLAAVPVGKIHLFDLDLKSIESRILTHPWIKEAHLQKKFPQTLSIAVVLKQPKALIQNARGSLSYVDEAGKAFGPFNFMHRADLPILSGFTGDAKDRIEPALKLLELWEKSQTAKLSKLSSLIWDPEKGYRALLSYPLSSAGWSRTMVDLGSDIDETVSGQLGRLSQVLQYLGKHAIAARQVWADAGKKIVVKTAHGS